VALVCLLAATSTSQAQEWLRLDPTDWEVFVDFDGRWRRNENSQSTRDREVETGVRIRQSGYSLDRQIATFSLELEPRFLRGDFESPGISQTRDGEFVNYSGDVSVFHGTPFPFSFAAHASRVSGTIDGSLGSRSDFTSENRRLAVTYKNRAFPSTLEYLERLVDQTFQPGFGAVASQRDDILRTVRLKGRSSKMNAALEQSWFDDRVVTTDRDYQSTRANVNHRFNWGKGSTLHSRVDYFTRSGFQGYDKLDIAETARIRHTDSLTSSTAYRFQALSQQLDTIEHQGEFVLTHRLYRNLTTSLRAKGARVDSDAFNEDEYEGGLDLNYTKKIFWGGRFGAAAGAAYRLTDRDSTGALLDVVDESHVVPATLDVILDQRFVDRTTVVVTDGAGVIVFVEGVDYDLVAIADDFTEIRAIPGGQINASDTILVSYRFESLPSVRFATVPYHYSVSLDFDWIRLFHRFSASEESLIAGQGESLLIDRRNRSTGVELRWARPPARATLTAEQRFSKSGAFETDSLNFGQSFAYTLSPTARLTFTASQIFSTSAGRDTNLYNANVSVRWRPYRNLSIRPHLSAWVREDEGSAITGGRREEQFFSGGFELRWTWRKIEVSLRYEHIRRQGTITDTDEDRVMLRLVRFSG
jgi:hypothetical protein